MPNVTSIQLTKLSQSAQVGGYWLLSGEVSEPLNTVHAFYGLKDDSPIQSGLQPPIKSTQSNPITFSLFDYQHPKIQLLSSQPLDQNVIDASSIKLLNKTDSEIIIQTEQACLFLGSDLGIGPLFYSAKKVKQNAHQHLALLHATHHFPFMVKPAHFMLTDFPFEAIGGCSLLEDWKIANRLASDSSLVGCFDGSIIELLAPWLEAENQRQLSTPLNWRVISFLPESTNDLLVKLTQTAPWLKLHTINTPE
jgi:hypothetical protein